MLPGTFGVLIARAFRYDWTPFPFVGIVFVSSPILFVLGMIEFVGLQETRTGRPAKRVAVYEDIFATLLAFLLNVGMAGSADSIEVAELSVVYSIAIMLLSSQALPRPARLAHYAQPGNRRIDRVRGIPGDGFLARPGMTPQVTCAGSP